MKNMEKGDFEYNLECAAPKGWSKYTTGMVKLKDVQRIPHVLSVFFLSMLLLLVE